MPASPARASIPAWPQLTRRRDPEPRHETWRVFYGDIHVGTISERAGVPTDVDQWGWSCGFHPDHGRRAEGTAMTFDQARAEFEVAWREYLPTCTDADFEAYRRQRAWTQWKYEMWDTGCRLPTQMPELRSRCFCGAEIGVACDEHVFDRHMEAA